MLPYCPAKPQRYGCIQYQVNLTGSLSREPGRYFGRFFSSETRFAKRANPTLPCPLIHASSL